MRQGFGKVQGEGGAEKSAEEHLAWRLKWESLLVGTPTPSPYPFESRDQSGV